MFEEIRKLFKMVKRGIVVVENGKPSYVIVPFDEYRSSGRETESVPFPRGVERRQEIDDVSFIQKMIDYESASRVHDAGVAETEMGVQAVLDGLERDEGGERGSPGGKIRLEDLPF